MDAALLVLDIQKDFIGSQARMPVADHHINPMLERINHLINEADSKGIPVIYIANEFEPRQFIFNWFRKNAALKGSSGAELDERLHIVNENYYTKNKGDALSNSKLVLFLKRNYIKRIHIVGLFAEGCVAATAIGGLRRDFAVTVVEDAVAGASDEKRRHSLNKLQAKGVRLVHSTEICQEFNAVTS